MSRVWGVGKHHVVKLVPGGVVMARGLNLAFVCTRGSW